MIRFFTRIIVGSINVFKFFTVKRKKKKKNDVYYYNK